MSLPGPDFGPRVLGAVACLSGSGFMRSLSFARAAGVERSIWLFPRPQPRVVRRNHIYSLYDHSTASQAPRCHLSDGKKDRPRVLVHRHSDEQRRKLLSGTGGRDPGCGLGPSRPAAKMRLCAGTGCPKSRSMACTLKCDKLTPDGLDMFEEILHSYGITLSLLLRNSTLGCTR